MLCYIKNTEEGLMVVLFLILTDLILNRTTKNTIKQGNYAAPRIYHQSFMVTLPLEIIALVTICLNDYRNTCGICCVIVLIDAMVWHRTWLTERK